MGYSRKNDRSGTIEPWPSSCQLLFAKGGTVNRCSSEPSVSTSSRILEERRRMVHWVRMPPVAQGKWSTVTGYKRVSAGRLEQHGLPLANQVLPADCPGGNGPAGSTEWMRHYLT